MYSNMCVKIALCLALVASIDGSVIKHHEIPLSPDGMVVDITVRDRSDAHLPVALMKIDIDVKGQKVVMSMGEPPTRAPKDLGSATDVLPSLEDRHGILVGTCPIGYTRRGGFCFPDDDY